MFGVGMGVTGAGLSTGLSQTISFFILLYMFRSGKVVTDVSLRHASHSARTYTNIMKVGFSSLVRQALNAASTIFLNRASIPYGDACIAAMSIVGRIQFFAGSVMIGLGQGLQPVASFNYGAKKYSRIASEWAVLHPADTYSAAFSWCHRHRNSPANRRCSRSIYDAATRNKIFEVAAREG